MCQVHRREKAHGRGPVRAVQFIRCGLRGLRGAGNENDPPARGTSRRPRQGAESLPWRPVPHLLRDAVPQPPRHPDAEHLGSFQPTRRFQTLRPFRV
jgi:hypothetical protein